MLHLSSWMTTLPMMLIGMVGILLVIGVIVLAVMLLNRLTSRKEFIPSSRDVRIQKPPKSFLRFSGGWFYAPVFLTPMHKRYSISMRLGFAGRAFCCCGAGSTMCRMPSSNFAWMSSFFTASPT